MSRAFAFEQTVLGAIRTHGLVEAGDRLLVAASGGPDSTALLAVLEALARRGEIAVTLAIAHLNHHTRGAESDRDADFVRALAERLGVAFFVGGAPELAGLASHREERARDARFAFLRRTAEAWRASATCLAHTRDDQAETVLLRLARGAGPGSLAGMAPRRADGVIRPLLETSRAQCVAYLEARGWTWVHDSSNDDETLLRNRVRRRLLPVLEHELGVDVRARLARLAGQLRQESALADQRVDALLGGARGGAPLALETLRASGAGASRVLHAWLAGAGLRATERQIASVLRVARSGAPSGRVDLGAGRRVLRCYEELRLESGDAPDEDVAAEVELDVPGSVASGGWHVAAQAYAAPTPAPTGESTAPPWRAAFDLARLKRPLCVRAPRAGDRVRLVYGRRKLADILVDAHVPRHERSRLAVVTDGEHILWVPGVVQSVVARPGPATRELVFVSAERRSERAGSALR